MPENISKSVFGVLDNGREIAAYTLSNAAGTEVTIIGLGAIITALRTRDRNGGMADITLGFDNPSQYLTESPFFGAVVGRYANRIREGRFELDGREYNVAVNKPPNHLHGGVDGFSKKLWDVEPPDGAGCARLHLSLASADGEEGYPGALNTGVTYTLDDQNDLTVEYRAVTDKPTVVNLTQHAYFNLNGHDAGSIEDHRLALNADAFTAVDANMIPTGELLPVDDTPMDFREEKAIGSGIDAAFEQLALAGGFDHNWVLDSAGTGDRQKHAASVYAPTTGRTLDVFTDQPGIQFYAGNSLDGSITGKDGALYRRRAGFCLETQHYPDSPNHAHFPTTVLRPGETFDSQTVFRFGVRG